MASSEALPVERLTLADLPGCLALSREAQWNQVEADWRLFFDCGLVWGIRLQGVVIASAALLPYPPQTAWISMVLTAKAARGRGFAQRLTGTALADCTSRGLVPQLDATPEGERVYRQFGLQTLARLTRWRRPSAATPARAANAPGSVEERIESVCRLDEAAIGFARPALLRWLLDRGPAQVTPNGFALSRDGRTARQIGPIVAASADEAEALLNALHERLGEAEAVIIDALDTATALSAVLEAQGYRPERPFLRMAKASAPTLDPTRYLAVAGPELG